MSQHKFLVVGATGRVGSQVAVRLANTGYNVTAMVRHEGTAIQDPYRGSIRYVTAQLGNAASLRKALVGIDVVISTANGVVPQAGGGDAGSVNEAALSFISLCEEAGVKRFVQSSTPTFPNDHRVPELHGKRLIEKRLAESPMQSIIIRNPAFMDVFLVFSGFIQAENTSAHATTKRQYGFGKWWLNVIGDLVVKHGMMIAPGGAKHGSPMIATRDVAEMLVGGALFEGSENLLIESGGPEWLTWRQVADKIAAKIGRKKIRIIPLPAGMARLNQLLARPFSKSVANTFALMSFVAAYQPRWSPDRAIELLKLPPLMTLSEYLDANYRVARGSPRHDSES